MLGILGIVAATPAQSQSPTPAPPEAVLLTFSGSLEVAAPGGAGWAPGQPNQILHIGDQIRTGKNSRATLRMSDLSVVRVYASTTMEIKPPSQAQHNAVIDVKSGATYFFNRDKPQETEFQTPSASGAIRGTEFNLAVSEDGQTELALLDGQVTLSNDAGSIELQTGEKATVDKGKAPQKTALINAVNIIQWTLYYPAILDLDDLGLAPQDQQGLAPSLEAYRAGDLLKALANYPAGRAPASDLERVYNAQLLLANGNVEGAQALLRQSAQDSRAAALADALQEMIAAVKGQPWNRTAPRTLATEWMAGAYQAQAHRDLGSALQMAKNAAAKSPNFGFALERVAELEFSFGHTALSRAALDKSLAASPRNAQALALRGFVAAAQTRLSEARTYFDQAIAADGSLGNGWLGRGLVRIRRGEVDAGRKDLEVAAALEPDRSFLRSYLGKAWTLSKPFQHSWDIQYKWDTHLARKEFGLAERLDPNDPTPWLYSALLNYNEYNIADAIHDLDESMSLNTNRAVYRSRLLLDQDQAVRAANLADIYKDVGMVDVSLEEASRSVAYDPANFSAHLNLASTYDQLRDPTRFDLRYETVTLSELMLADMLAPPGANSLSENLSQQEYASLFAVNSIGLDQTAEVFSDGEYRQRATQFGNYGDTAWASDIYYNYKSGFRVNNELSNIEWNTRIKQQVTPQDSLFILTEYENYSAGDQYEYYDPSQANKSLHLTETQEPLLFVGWDHQWGPGSHTLFLGGRLNDDQHETATNYAPQDAITKPLTTPGNYIPFDLQYQSQWEIYTAELNQILQHAQHTDIFGARYQEGRVNAQDSLSSPPSAYATDFALPAVSSANADLERFSAYEYHHWQIVDQLMLIGGVSFDHERYPSNFRRPPLSSGESERDQWSPKGALIWTPAPALTLRAAYSQDLGGVLFEESTRLEPTQLAGFVQDYRTLMPESITGEVEAPRYQIGGAAMDWRMNSNTWLTLQAQAITERADEQYGIFSLNFAPHPPPIGAPSSTTENLDYHENTARLTLNHILDKQWFVQAQYQYSHSELKTSLPDITAPSSFGRVQTLSGNLQQLSGSLTWQAPSGLFAEAEILGNFQDLSGFGYGGRSFAQANLYGGYRFRNRRAEVICGVLNLTGGDFHLSPVNYYLDLPHQRLFYTRIRFNF